MNTAILRSRILDMAIRGQLVPQDPNEGTAMDLLKEIAHQRGKAITPITDNVPFSIPDNWCWVKLGDIIIDMADGPFGSNLKKEHYTTKQEARIIQLSNIGEKGWRDENIKYTTFSHATNNIARSIVLPGNLVIAKMMPAGRTIICPDNEKMYVLSSDSIKCVPPKSINTEYLYRVLNSAFFRSKISEDVQGVTRARTSIKKLKDASIPLPPLPEQRRIVAKVEELLGEVDKIEHAQTDITHAATILRSRVLDMAIQGELTHSNTEEWENVKLGDICKTTSGGTPQSKNPLYYQGGDIPWLQSGELHQKYITNTAKKITQAGYDNSSAKYYPINSVLIALYGATVGEVSISKIALTSNQAICAIFPSEKVYEEYLYYFLKTKKNEYIGLASGGAQPNISQEKVKATILPLPPLSEQRRIVAMVEELFAEIDKLIN